MLQLPVQNNNRNSPHSSAAAAAAPSPFFSPRPAGSPYATGTPPVGIHPSVAAAAAGATHFPLHCPTSSPHSRPPQQQQQQQRHNHHKQHNPHNRFQPSLSLSPLQPSHNNKPSFFTGNSPASRFGPHLPCSFPSGRDTPAVGGDGSHRYSQQRPLPPPKRGILRKPGGDTTGRGGVRGASVANSPRRQSNLVVKFLLSRGASSVVTRPNESSGTGSTASDDSRCARKERHRRYLQFSSAHKGGRKQQRQTNFRAIEAMVARTAPGPLSVGLYIFLWILTLAVLALCGSREWRLAQAWRTVRPLERYMKPVSCEPDPANTGEIVHIDCPLRELERFSPPSEFSWNVEPFTGVFFETRVEMYQWVLKPEFLGVKFTGVWSQDVLGRRRASLGLYDTHINPDFIPRVSGAGRQFVKSLVGGGFSLPKRHLPEFRKAKQLPLIDDPYYTRSQEQPPTQINYRNTHVYKDALYSGDPKAPQVGDIRVTFWGSASTHVSAVGEQSQGMWGAAYLGPPGDEKRGAGSSSSSSKHAIDLVAEGDHRPAEIIAEFKKKKGGSIGTRWCLRVSAWIFLTTLVAFTHRMVDRHGHTRLGPFVIGSMAVALGIMCGALCPLWCTVQVWRGVVLGVGALAALVAGVFCWRWGKTLVAPWEIGPGSGSGTEFTPMKRHAQGPAGTVAAAGAPLLGVGQEKPQHFYQAI